MITALISRLMILAFGTLYPAYASYKAVRTKDVKEYVKWMMYWIVFALFTCAETFTDVLFSFWFPFYYEIKVAIVIWLLSPATKGSSFLYRHFVHPAFLRRENEIDEMLAKAKERGYSTVMSLGSRGVTYATNVILQTAMKGGGGLVDHIRKSYSLTDLGPKRGDRFLRPDETDLSQGDALGGGKHYLRRMLSAGPSEDFHPVNEEEELTVRPALRRRPPGSTGVDMRFKEVDVNMRQFHASTGPLGDIQSTEDISSGYSSTDQLFPGQSELALSRSASVTSRGRGRSSRATQPKRTPLTEEAEGEEYGLSSESLLSPAEPFQLPNPELIEPLTLSNPESSRQSTLPNPKPNDSSTLPDIEPNEPFKVSSIIRKFSGCVDDEQVYKMKLAVLDLQESNLTLSSPDENLAGSQTSLASSSSNKSERKGKYKKLPAPPPPKPPSKSEGSPCSDVSNISFANADKRSLFFQSLAQSPSTSSNTTENTVNPDSKTIQKVEENLNLVAECEKPFETTV